MYNLIKAMNHIDEYGGNWGDITDVLWDELRRRAKKCRYPYDEMMLHDFSTKEKYCIEIIEHIMDNREEFELNWVRLKYRYNLTYSNIDKIHHSLRYGGFKEIGIKDMLKYQGEEHPIEDLEYCVNSELFKGIRTLEDVVLLYNYVAGYPDNDIVDYISTDKEVLDKLKESFEEDINEIDHQYILHNISDYKDFLLKLEQIYIKYDTDI